MGSSSYGQYKINLDLEDAVGWYKIPESFHAKVKGKKLQKDIFAKLHEALN